MCMNSVEISPCSALTFFWLHGRPSKRHNLRIRRLNRRRRSPSKEGKRKEKLGQKLKAEMKLKNLMLYRENRSIIEENEKLRKKALLLHQENQALLSQLQTKFPSYSRKSDH